MVSATGNERSLRWMSWAETGGAIVIAAAANMNQSKVDLDVECLLRLRAALLICRRYSVCAVNLAGSTHLVGPLAPFAAQDGGALRRYRGIARGRQEVFTPPHLSSLCQEPGASCPVIRAALTG